MARLFNRIRGAAAPLPQPNIDTDVIMPKQFLKGIDRSGLDRGVFHDLRFLPDDNPNPNFVLNQSAWRDSAFLVVGPNFGCGSSREHAVWGLVQLGLRALIGTSFAGIFFDNCARNGLLAIALPPADLNRLMALAGDPATNCFDVDLPAQTIACDAVGEIVPFEIDPRHKEALASGLDAIGWALERSADISAFEEAHFRREPWLRPAEAAQAVGPKSR